MSLQENRIYKTVCAPGMKAKIHARVPNFLLLTLVSLNKPQGNPPVAFWLYAHKGNVLKPIVMPVGK
jgi:hypothetical protein